MANEEFVTHYNQLVWQMDQLRNETIEASATYAAKLKAISKRMHRVNEQLESVTKELARRGTPRPVPHLSGISSNTDAGFHP